MSTDGSSTASAPHAVDAEDTRLWVIAAGGDVYVLHSESTAEAQYTVCIGASLDAYMFRMTAEQWAQARAELAKGDDEITIIDTQQDHPETVGGSTRHNN